MTPLAEQLLVQFADCPNWEQRARLVLQCAALLPAYPTEQLIDQQLVEGCAAKVWLHVSRTQPTLELQIESEARLLKGLLGILYARVNGLSSEQLATLNIEDWFNQLGLAKQLTASRANGLHQVLKAIIAATK